MSLLKKALWIAVALAAAVSFAGIAKIFRPDEKVNALWLLTAAACCYALAYRFYARFLARKILELDPSRPTPAYTRRDGVDFEPTPRPVLFGHHFAAIAGAGPLIGPMLAAQFGYLPGFLWILVGTVFAGAVQDMVVLGLSVRRNGRSLPEIAREEVGPVGGAAASVAVIFIIIVALAGLGLAVVNALFENAWGVYTLALTIPVALFVGLYMSRLRPGRVAEGTVIGVLLLLFAVFSGHWIPDTALGHFLSLDRDTLALTLAAYGFLASVLPVWLLLCPRDYLSTYMKIGTVMLLTAGVIFMAPELSMPAVTQFIHGNGPVIPGKVFPFMFITIACGAISGFHSLISSGTTPKMIESEAHIPLIGYGSMLVEGFVGVTALVAASVLVPGDYFAINSRLPLDALAALGFPPERIHELSALVGVDVQGRPGGAVSLAVGMASILTQIPGMTGLMPYWYNFALMFEALFILTTIDAGTRVARFLLQEMGGRVYAPLGRHRWLPGILLTSGLVVVAWGYLLHSGSVATIWPMFGVANQLLGAVAFGVISVILLKQGKARYLWVSLAPMIFMYVTTFTAGIKLLGIFSAKAAAAKTAKELFDYRVDFALLAVMLALALVALLDMVWKASKVTRTKP